MVAAPRDTINSAPVANPFSARVNGITLICRSLPTNHNTAPKPAAARIDRPAPGVHAARRPGRPSVIAPTAATVRPVNMSTPAGPPAIVAASAANAPSKEAGGATTDTSVVASARRNASVASPCKNPASPATAIVVAPRSTRDSDIRKSGIRSSVVSSRNQSDTESPGMAPAAARRARVAPAHRTAVHKPNVTAYIDGRCGTRLGARACVNRHVARTAGRLRSQRSLGMPGASRPPSRAPELRRSETGTWARQVGIRGAGYGVRKGRELKSNPGHEAVFVWVLPHGSHAFARAQPESTLGHRIDEQRALTS